MSLVAKALCVAALLPLTFLTLPSGAVEPAPAPRAKLEFRAAQAGKMQLADVSIHAAAVIDEANVVVVGTKFNKDGDSNPDTLDPNGAFVDLAKKTSRPFTNGHLAAIYGLAVSRGRVLTVSGVRDPFLRVWDLKAGKGLDAVQLENRDADGSGRHSVAAFHKDKRVAVALFKDNDPRES